MWKDFFYFSRGQRTGIIVLVVLIAMVIAANYMLPWFFSVTEENPSGFQAEVAQFKKSLVSRDSLRQIQWQQRYAERQRLFEQKYKNSPFFTNDKTHSGKQPYTLFPFDPNTLDSSGFVRLGLKSYIASNILKYRKKGGVFRSTPDFGKVYGVSPEKFKELEPYIRIAENNPVTNEPTLVKRTDLIVELNSADTSLLMQVKGIGRGYARAIVRFRQQAGGFVSVDQLGEIYGMRPENFEKIRQYCTVNPALVRPIKVNTATVDRLRSHPYLNFYKARAIYEFRRNRGRLRDIGELKELPEFTPAELEKIKPYLSFE